MAKKKKQEAVELKALEAKWTPQVLEAGWTALPAALIEHQRALGIDAIDMNIILHIANRWWTADNRPFPSKNSIAEAMKIDPSTVRRRIQAMEKAGLVQREERRIKGKGSKTNLYHLDGLIKELQPFAADMVEKKKERMAEKEARYGQKGKPKLVVNNDQDDDE